MDAAFDLGSSSDEGSPRRRRRRLPPPPADGADVALPASDGGADAAGRDDDGDEGAEEDEEAELRRMRQSAGYAQFKERYRGGDRARGPEPAADAARESEGVDSAADASVAESGHADGAPQSTPLSKPDGTLTDGTVNVAAASAVEEDGNDGEDEDGDSEGGAVGPALPPGMPVAPRRVRRAIDPKIVDDSSDSDSDDDDNESTRPGGGALDALPLTHEAALGTTHGACVTALALDPAGARLATAGADAELRLWDFGSMDSRLLSFRAKEPLDALPVSSVEFSRSGGRLLVAGGLSVARVLDRDGHALVETVPGDMYIVDMARTKGHAAPLAGARWTRDACFATAAGDATLRVWDMAAATAPRSAFDGDLPRAKQLRVIKLRTAKGGKKAHATALAVVDGGVGGGGGGQPRVAVGCDDGSIKVVDTEAFSLRPSAETLAAAAPGAGVSALAHRSGSPLLLSRSGDDALRVFDLRRFDKPVAEFTGLPNAVAQTGVTFVGDGGSHFATGTSGNRRGGTERARLVVYDARTLTQAWDAAVEQERGSVVSVAWHPRTNQLLYGCADGSVHVMYRPETSTAGVLQCLVKHARRKAQHGMASVAVGEIYTPSSLAEAQRRRKAPAAAVAAPERRDAPDAARMASSFTKAFMSTKAKATWADEDPRQALLRYEKEGDAKAVLAGKTRDQEEEEEMEKLRARDRVGAKRQRE